jgi:hypothetical protein
VLMKDIEAYLKISTMLERAETVDMMSCLKDICFSFMINPAKVSKYVMEDLRHLETPIVLALVRARWDYVTQKFGHHWTRDLAAAFPTFHLDPPLAWEIGKTDKKEKKNAKVPEASIDGPSTLRKSTAPLSESRRLQLTRDVLVKKITIGVPSSELPSSK